MNKEKKNRGQFFTTNADHILQGFEKYIKGKTIIDPFAGNGDLLSFAYNNGAKKLYGLDIDRSLVSDTISYNDSLLSIPHFPFILTNPPYLAKNKMAPGRDKELYFKQYDDLYLLAIKKIMDAKPNEGIIIVPINFFSAENSNDLRAEFLSLFEIPRVNYFMGQVFDDTTYNVVSFYFRKKSNNSQNIEFSFFPGNHKKIFKLGQKYQYCIGGKDIDIINKTIPLKIIRLTDKFFINNPGEFKIDAFFNDKSTNVSYLVNKKTYDLIYHNIILLNCIDTNSSKNGWVSAENINNFGKDCLVGKKTSRNIAYVLLPKEITIEKQKNIIKLFNSKLNELRDKYHSLFLTNFRDNNRKRISFEFAYKLISKIYEEMTKK